MDGIRLFSDADNTLWDTNSVYARAQVGIARDIAVLAASSRLTLMDDGDVLRIVRRYDQNIAHEHPEHLGYPPILLARALYAYFGGDGEAESLGVALDIYERALHAIPKLRPGVRESLPEIVFLFGPFVLVTETKKSRCERILKHYGLEEYVERVVYDKKSPQLYRRLRDKTRHDVMVGDQPDRDVGYSKQAGFVGVLFPAGFSPFWTASQETKPDHTISDFRELTPILSAISA